MNKENQIDIIAQNITFTETTFFTAKCDECNYALYNAFYNDEPLEEILYDEGWRIKEDKMLCPKCALIKGLIYKSSQ